MQDALQLLNVPTQWAKTKGRGVRVAVIDQAAFKNRVPSIHTVNYDPTDGHWHASSVCYIINQIAPAAEIFSLKYFGSGSWNLKQCLEWCMENKIDIVNMSFHTPINDDEIINKACETGIILVSSAGNIGYDPSDNDTEVTYPATMPKMIAVASYDPKSKGIAGYSSGGPEVDTTAPGNLEVPFPPSFVSGTSFASPCVAGILALVKSVAPELNYETAEKLIKMYSKDIDKPGKDDRSGYGLFVLPSPNVWVPEVEKLIGGSGMAKFSDIEGHVLEAEIEEAADRGLVNGFSDGTFKPDEPVTRAQVAAIAVRLFKLISKLFLRKAT